MTNKVKNVIFLITFFIFILLITKYYFSEQNIIFTNKSRISYEVLLNSGKNDLPILKNDKKNIKKHLNDLENFKNKRKKRFWEKLISNTNE